jgi:hypothetical protein
MAEEPEPQQAQPSPPAPEPAKEPPPPRVPRLIPGVEETRGAPAWLISHKSDEDG